ncbi:MAG: hypothetical protein FP812_10055, partial [Desulfobacula sp.]|nr:hypothetical protein [Desulfobacula sp.]
LSDYRYKNIPLKFISAYSGEEAKIIIGENPDIACCLLDVVMESKDAGLEVARFIREEKKNTKLRIILRTGQPGKAPEKHVILNYDINDYKEKTELTDQKLFTTITTALRSYIHLVELEKKSKEILAQNNRLNEEIARRIVAESNLTKYNRSLEKMIENKSTRLKTALLDLTTTENKLHLARKAAIVSDISIFSLDTFGRSTATLDANLKQMNLYRQKMTLLLEKYNTLEKIIVCHKEESLKKEEIKESLLEITAYKHQIKLDTILKNYPHIIQDATKGIEQISRGISDIRLFTAINEEPYQPTDLNLLLNEAAAIQKNKFKAKIDIQLDLERIPIICLPANQIEKAINAILKNAFQAVKSKGIISVSSQCLDTNIIIRISDIGCGISKEDLPHVCTPYFTGKNNTGGKGLGLALAKNILLSCEGDMDIVSTQNEGTTVTIVLPVRNKQNKDKALI